MLKCINWEEEYTKCGGARDTGTAENGYVKWEYEVSNEKMLCRIDEGSIQELFKS